MNKINIYMNRFNKYMEYLITKIKVFVKEKRFYNRDYCLKYILERHQSNVLIVIFSGCTRIGLKARYNYNRTLKNIKANKLFILDDFGYDQRGAYYLGHNMDFKIQEVVKELIYKIQKDLNTDKTLYIGSSKGGYASLYFGMQEENSIIIAGAPQYFLGNYLHQPDYEETCLKYIIGKDVTDDKILLLNNLLSNMISKNAANNNSVYLHFSDSEPTYEKQIKDLISCLKKNNVTYYTDVGKYTNHGDVSLHFPQYLIRTIKELI